MLFGDAMSFDFSARKYFAGQGAGADSGGKDRVLRADTTFTLRLRGRHALALNTSRLAVKHPCPTRPAVRSGVTSLAFTTLFCRPKGWDW
jgi:hypothetical protein